MSKFVVIVFPNEAQAYQGTRALKDLHVDGSLSLYGMAVIAKDAAGNVKVKESVDPGPLGTAVGALLGGLVGLLGGPVGVVAGATGGTVLGSLFDIVNLGVGEDYVTKVSEELGPGKSAVIAEIDETWTTPLDTRMGALNGTVLRTWRSDFEDDQIAKEVAAEEADFEALKAEYAQATAEAKANLKAKLDQAKADLKRADARLQARIDELNNEMDARLAAQEKQIATAQAEAKEKIKKRMAAIRADYTARSAKLKQAWTLTKEALAA